MPYDAGVARATPSRLEGHAWSATVDQPTLFLDVDAVRAQYRALSRGLGRASIHYAMKANPHEAILDALRDEGAAFDAASRAEIMMCLEAGIRPDQISFGNTVKRASDIAFAHDAGITLFAADSAQEIEKIAAHAPGAEIYIRLLLSADEADWPLSRKFGCAPERTVQLMDLARKLGLVPVGISFHVGSQARHPSMWQPVLDRAQVVWDDAKAAGHDLKLLNIGGGFPAYYGRDIPDPTTYAADVMAMVDARFDAPHIMAEPGRGLVAEAGVIVAEVLLVDRKSDSDTHRWVYLDIGKFSGLAETIDEAIRYQFLTRRDHEPKGPCVVAGPSCDSADVLYEKRPMLLPVGLRAGDRVLIRNTGAYTSTYASVGFNGFPPLDVQVLPPA
ncbi:MAG: type III PLP-dependent enzyme [Pseudomonadota bacterium]